jgi:hypothetical protein
VRFCYCRKCDKLQARNWYSRGRCEICTERCVVFTVNRTFYGWLMYALDIFAVAMIALYLVDYQPLVDAMSVIGAQIAIFGSIILSFVFAFVDVAKTTKKAEEKVRSGRILPPQGSP